MDLQTSSPIRTDWRSTGSISQLVDGIRKGMRNQVSLARLVPARLYTIASVIQELQMPALIMAHNKTLAAQLYAEFKEFFPENAVEYFVSYYDYYQPEAYVPRHDFYIEKETEINEEIERLRLRHDILDLAARCNHRRLSFLHLWSGSRKNLAKPRCHAGWGDISAQCAYPSAC